MVRPFTPEGVLSDFDFDLPSRLIASRAAEPRESARLLHVGPQDFADRHVFDLPTLLRPGDVLVLNDTKVVPARLFGMRGAVKVEILLNKSEGPDQDSASVWACLARPGKRLRVGDGVRFAEDFEAEVVEKRQDGQVVLRFPLSRGALFEALGRHGHVPLPPYIDRPEGDTPEDRARYQTVYARREGAVAAPTAGLHFTSALMGTLETQGVSCETVTLHVGAGTFLPVKTERLADHVMHAEWGEIAPATAARLTAAKGQGRRIIPVGTTSLRLLESAADENGIIHPFSGETDIFITPGYRFRAADALITNFHLPKSTLFMLVAALMGTRRMKEAYAHAIARDYRFYSYGDACFLEP